MCKNVEGLNGKTGKAVDWAVTIARIITPLLLTGMAFLWWNHETRIAKTSTDLAVMSGNRFTAADGLKVWQAMALLQSEIATKANVTGAAPVLVSIDELKRRIERLESDTRR